MPLWVKKPNTVLSAALSVLLGLGSFSLSLVEPSSVIAASSKTQQAIQENQQIYSNTGVREVVDDPLAQKGIYKRIFDHVLAGDPANQATANFINLRSKELLHKHISLTVRIHSILWQSEKTALVQWSETAWLPNGSSVNNGTYEGYVTVKVVPPRATTDSTFQLNPLGIYIEKFSWTRES